MSNDTNFSINFRHKSKAYLKQIQEYLQQKKARSDAFRAACIFNQVPVDHQTLMDQLGATSFNEVVTWGFNFGACVKEGDKYHVNVTAWANQNTSNVHVTGDDGELADILERFPEVEIEGEFSDEYGKGIVQQTSQEYTSYDEEDENEVWNESEEEEVDGAKPILAVEFTVDQLADPPGTLCNSIGMKCVLIPTGEFWMGGRDGDEGDTDEEEMLHKVRITRPFYMGMFSVTQGEYASMTKTNPSVCHGKTRPVEHVSWKQAVEFCKLLSDLPSERTAGRKYRLPTEAEWEYACRAGTTTAFNCGDMLGPDHATFCLSWTHEPQVTTPVGMYPPNAFGLFDMHGNVWEWCQDWYSLGYYRKSPIDDPKGPKKGTHHVLRGGSASVQPDECRSAIRGESPTDAPDPESEQRFAKIGDFGFRVVCEIQ